MKKLDKALLYEKVIGNIEKDLSERKIGGAIVKTFTGKKR